ncbi:MAG: Uma2 family endonuclease [Synechococcales cyanobacterium RM1_1_8]|nr:Uma2 family endonuclease [Synechococcales cyanobacterium RM1_1_8]
MTFTTDRPIQQKPLNVDEFLSQYGGDKRYELIDGEVFDLEPTGPHEQVASFITKQVSVQIVVNEHPWAILQRPLFRPSGSAATAFRPDVAVIDEVALAEEPLWAEQSILTRAESIKFVAEVVSSNWQNDYARKFEDYEALGIAEYWIADYAGLGGVYHIGRPKQPTLTVCQLGEDGRYEKLLLRGEQWVASRLFPGLRLTAAQVLGIG